MMVINFIIPKEQKKTTLFFEDIEYKNQVVRYYYGDDF
jgi:hypothetical protein